MAPKSPDEGREHSARSVVPTATAKRRGVLRTTTHTIALCLYALLIGAVAVNSFVRLTPNEGILTCWMLGLLHRAREPEKLAQTPARSTELSHFAESIVLLDDLSTAMSRRGESGNGGDTGPRITASERKTALAYLDLLRRTLHESDKVTDVTLAMLDPELPEMYRDNFRQGVSQLIGFYETSMKYDDLSALDAQEMKEARAAVDGMVEGCRLLDVFGQWMDAHPHVASSVRTHGSRRRAGPLE
jgi:hypothetical protein